MIDFKDGFLFHASSIAVDNKGYLFTAHSGVGKSTHAKIWKKLLGDRLTYINDDKPVIRKVGEDFFVYGTPWNGKHKLDSDKKVKIQAICMIRRSDKNFVEPLDKKDAIALFMEQSLRFNEQERTVKYLSLIDGLLSSADTFVINCNTEDDAGRVAIKEILGEVV